MDETTIKPKRGRPKGAKDIQPRKRKESPANWGEEYVKPGDNTKYLRHALDVQNLGPIDIKDPQDVQDRITEYFALCMDNDVKPTVTGLCNALRISKECLRLWKLGEIKSTAHQDAVLRAYRMLEELWENYMVNGKINPVSGIFLAKNMFNGYSDKQELVLTPNQPGVEPIDAAEIAAKYEYLPEIDDQKDQK